MGDFADQIYSVLNVAPDLSNSPGVAAALAQAGVGEDATAATAGMNAAAQMKQYFQSLDNHAQFGYYQGLSDDQRNLLASVGVTAPKNPSSSRGGLIGFFDSVRKTVSKGLGLEGMSHSSDPVDRAVEGAVGAVGHVGSNLLGDAGAALGVAGHALGAPLRMAQHAERAEIVAAGGADANTGLAGRLSALPTGPLAGLKAEVNLLNQSGWNPFTARAKFAQIWKQTELGDRTFDQRTLQGVQAKYDPQVFNLAKQVAMGTKPQDLVATSQDQAATIKLLESQTLNDAVTDVNGAKLSFGRYLANTLGIHPDGQHSKVFHLTSGLADGMNSFFADPVILAGKARGIYQASRYAVDAGETSSRINNLFQTAPVRRYFDQASQHLSVLSDSGASSEAKAKAYGALRTNHTALSGLIDDMVTRKVDSTDGIREYLLNTDSTLHILQGNAAMRVPLMPHMSKYASTIINAREKWGTPIDWLEQGPRLVRDDEALAKVREKPLQDAASKLADLRSKLADDPENVTLKAQADAAQQALDGLVSSPATAGERLAIGRQTWRGRMATVLTRASTPVTELKGGKLDIHASDAHEQIYRFARTFGPKQYATQVSSAFLGADTAGRRQIIKGLYQTMGEAAGINQTAAGRQWLSSLTDDVNNLGLTRAYSPAGDDLLDDGRHTALLPTDQRQLVQMPSFRDMYAASAQIGVLDRMGLYGTHPLVDAFTDRIFRPFVLLRPALVVRNGGEEVVSHVVRNGARDYLKGRVAAKVADPDSHAILNGLTGHLPDQVNSPASWFLSHTRWALRTFTGTKLDDQQEAWLKQASEREHLMHSYLEGIRETGSQSISNKTTDDLLQKPAVRGGGWSQLQFKETGDYKARSAEEYEGAKRWAIQLSKRAIDPAGQVALLHVRDEPTALRELKTLIETDEFAKYRNGSEMFHERGAEGWAKRIYNDAKLHVSDRNGNIIDSLVDDLTKDGKVDPKVATAGRLNEVPDADRPLHVVGREHVAVDTPETFYQRAVQHGFDVFGDWTVKLSKRPIFWANYLAERRNMAQYEQELAGKVGAERASAMVTDAAHESAIHKTLEYVDNPAIRSQFSVVARNYLPFWRAQEEFYRRWGRTAVYSPESFRKAQLIMEGARSSGMVKKDAQGNDYFIYPGTGALTEAMVKAGRAFGVNMAQPPFPYALRGEVRFLNQGIDPKNVLPSAGPLLAFPTQILSRMYPELKPVEHGLLGDQGADQNPFLSYLPTPVRRAIEMFKTDDRTGMMASMTKQAAAYMEHAGLTPPDNASPEEVDRYQERLKNMARTLLGMRLAYGLFAPAAPEQMAIAPAAAKVWQTEGLHSVKDEFHQLVNTMGFEKAMAVWLKTHPDDMPFTVSSTENPSGANVPGTMEALQFYKANKGTFDNYKNAAAYFLPQDPGAFNSEAYREELANGLRASDTFGDFYKKLKLSGQLQGYFDDKKAHDDAVAKLRQAGDSQGVSSEMDSWRTYQQQFYTEHPFVQEYLANAQVRAFDREQTVNQLHGLLENHADFGDPKAHAAISDMLNAYEGHLDYQRGLTGKRDTISEYKRNVENQEFDAYMAQVASSNPNAQMLYNNLFRYMEG